MTNADKPVVIRPLRPEDMAEWRDLWTAYLAFYNTVLPDATFESSFARMLGDDPQDYHGLVAEHDGRIVGLTHYVFHRHGWQIADVCYLQDLYADPSVRGMGVGRALIEAVYAAADVAGAPRVYWNTQQDNTTARQLYDRLATLTPFVKYNRLP